MPSLPFIEREESLIPDHQSPFASLRLPELIHDDSKPNQEFSSFLRDNYDAI